MQRYSFVSQLRGFLLLGILAMYLGSSAQTSSYYHLITGSFTKLDDAKSLVADLKSQGYSPVILFPNVDSKHYRVSIYQSFNRDEVHKFNKAQKSRKKASGWILAMSDPSGTPNVGTPSNANARLTRSAGSSANESAEAVAYHLIVGSFDDFNSADGLVMALAQQGYEPYVIFPKTEGEKFRVSVYNANNRSEIEAYAGMLKKRGKEKGWIYEESEPAPSTLSTARIASRGGDDIASYHLIGGSFKTYAQALAYAEEMKSDGHTSVVLFPQVTQSDRFRVSIYQSNSQREVAKYRKQLEKSGKAAGWVYAYK